MSRSNTRNKTPEERCLDVGGVETAVQLLLQRVLDLEELVYYLQDRLDTLEFVDDEDN